MVGIENCPLVKETRERIETSVSNYIDSTVPRFHTPSQFDMKASHLTNQEGFGEASQIVEEVRVL